MKGTRHSEEQIIAILKQGEAGLSTADLCRQHNITEQTYYRWKAKYGGMDSSEAKKPAIEVDTSLGGLRVRRVLDRIASERGLPEAIVLDNGPEFRGRALAAWSEERGVRLEFIQPGKPVQNAYAESFNGRLRDECLNANWFTSLRDARRKIEDWRLDYNQQRPHSSLNYVPPLEFARTVVEMRA